MSWEVVHTASIRLLMLCLLTCVAYLVTFNIDTMCTRVLHCDVCIAMSWFILVLMLWISFVVAVPVSQLRASPRKGSRLLLCHALICSWLEFSSLVAEVIVVSDISFFLFNSKSSMIGQVSMCFYVFRYL